MKMSTQLWQRSVHRVYLSHHDNIIHVLSQYKQVQRATTLSLPSTPITFFEESDTYWAPSSNPSELYEQLAVKKYREIPRNQIQ